MTERPAGKICELDVVKIAALIIVTCDVDEDSALEASRRILRYVIENLTAAGASVQKVTA